MSSIGVWLGSEDPSDGEPLAAWWSEPSGAPESRPAVLLLPAVGYASSSSHHQLRDLAEGLAAAGIGALRLDYAGTGDSAGASEDLDSVDVLRSSVRRGVEALRAWGAGSVQVVGIQWGGTLSPGTAEALGLDGVVRIAPVASGRRFVRGLGMIAHPLPQGGVSDGGFVITAPLLEGLGSLDLPSESTVPALLIPAERASAFLEVPAEEAEPDDDLVSEVVEWVAAHAGSRAAPSAAAARGPSPFRRSALLAGDRVREEFVEVGPDRLRGVLSRSADPRPDHADVLYVLVNSGSDPHTGPGRAWTELARHLALDGFAALRVDLPGWGESDGPAVGRPYDALEAEATRRLVDSLAAEWGTVVLGGLCAGAWAALDVARDPGAAIAGAVVLNPQLYWQPGDPVEALMSTTHRRRAREIAEIAVERDAGRWDAEDERGARPPAAAWLDDLVDNGRAVSLVFAEGDDGIQYLHDRLSRRLDAALGSGVVRVVEVPGIDHAMHAAWLRPRMFAVIAEELARVASRAQRRREVSAR